MLLPRSVKIVVHDGRNLDYRVAGSKKTPQTRRWRVIFIGGEKKQATGIVDEQEGFPRWDCEVLIVTPKPLDTVSMLVVDGKERHVGQVVIPLAEIPPGPAPSLVTSQLHVRELEPTKHNSTPCGQLSFWLWAVDYWPEGTVAVPSKGIRSARSFKGSLSQLGSSLKPHSSAKSEHSTEGDSHSRLGAKIRGMKQRVGRKSPSHVQQNPSNSHSPVMENSYEGSVIIGGGSSRPTSILSSHTGAGPMGWVGSELATESNLNGGGAAGGGGGSGCAVPHVPASYNPLASPEDVNFSAAGRGLDRAPSLFAVNDPSGGAGDDVCFGGVPGEEKSKRKILASHLRQKISKSTANLSELGHKIRSRRTSPDGSRGEVDCSGRLETQSPARGSPPPQMRVDTRPIVRPSASVLEPNPNYHGPAMPDSALATQQRMLHEEWSLPAPPMPPSTCAAATTPASYGLHPEEGPGKAKSEMSKRELIELSNLLEQRLIHTRTELVRANMEQNQLNAQVEALNSELVAARTQLTSLRNRLLEDNMTRYLEVPGGGSSTSQRAFSMPLYSLSSTGVDQMLGGGGGGGTLEEGPSNPHRPAPGAGAQPSSMRVSQTRLDQVKSIFTGSSSAAAASAGGENALPSSFLSRAKAFASKPFGGGAGGSMIGVAGETTSQLNLSHQPLDRPLRTFSPPMQREIDYGSVW